MFIIIYFSHEEKIKNMGFFYIEYPTLVPDESEGPAAGAAPAKDAAAPAADAAPAEGGRKRKTSLSKSHHSHKEDAAAPAADAPAAEGEAAAPATQGKPAVFEKKLDKLLLFNNKDKLVLPMYCKSKLDAKEIYGLSTHAADYVNAWRESAANPEAEPESLPQLEPAAFAKFYANITADMFMDSEMLGSKEAESKADDLAFTINFQNANLKKVSWYQWWIFLCSAGVMPAKHEYSRPDPINNDIFLTKLKKNMGIHKRIRISKKFYRMRGRSKLVQNHHEKAKKRSHKR